MRKKRVTFTTDADQWARANKMLKEKGYPLGAMGFYLKTCVDALEEQLSSDTETQALLFSLDELRGGKK